MLKTCAHLLLFFSHLSFITHSMTQVVVSSTPVCFRLWNVERQDLLSQLHSFTYSESHGVRQLNVLVVGLEGTRVRDVAESLEEAKSDTVVEVLQVPYVEVANPTGRLSVGRFVPDLIVLVTDSTQQNVAKSRNIVRILNKQFPNIEKIAIANRQNQPGILSTEEVGEVLGLTTYERPAS